MAEEEQEEEPKKGGLMGIITIALELWFNKCGIGTDIFYSVASPDPSVEIEEIIERKMKEAEEAKAAEEAANAGPPKKLQK